MTRKKRVLFVVEAMGGGVFTYIVDLANQLCERYEMYVAYAVRPQTPADYKEYFNERIKLIEVKNFKRSVDLFRDTKALFEIRRIAKEVAPEVIHLHSSKAGALGRIAYARGDAKLFYTPHGYSFLMQNQRKYKTLMYRMIEYVLAKGRCTTISCSRGEHQETLKLTKFAHYVSNGINITQLEASMKDVRIEGKRPFTVFTIGRICKQKNPEMFNAIAEKLPAVDFLWIGDGELRELLTAPNITVTGWVDRDTVIQHSINGDVFLLCSLWEGLPISLLEAMYMRKLCIVSNVIGNRDVIQNERNGFICNDIDAYVRCIQAASHGIPKMISENASKDVMEKYNIDIMGQEYGKIYEF